VTVLLTKQTKRLNRARRFHPPAYSLKGWLLVSFVIWIGDRRIHVRLYPGIREIRDGRRSPTLKEIHDLIEMRRWDELARRYPKCRSLAPFRPAILERDATTFRQASERFLVYHQSINAKATVDFYRSVLKVHIWPADFADKALKLIGASDVTSLFGPVRQRGYHAQAANVRRTVSAVFNWARGERGADGEYLVTDNPVTRTKPVKIEREEDALEPFTADEARRIIAAARSGERRLATVAIGAGLRPNENFGLKRANIDLHARVIRIRQTYGRDGQGDVKTKRSRRDVNMTEPVYRALKEQLLETQLHSPWLWPISRTNPRPRNPTTFSRHSWPALLKRAGVKHRNLYQCRHTFATLLLQGGAEWRYVADQMGHADLTMLQKHYWKWRPGSIVKPSIDPIAEALFI
jgi:integrase